MSWLKKTKGQSDNQTGFLLISLIFLGIIILLLSMYLRRLDLGIFLAKMFNWGYPASVVKEWRPCDLDEDGDCDLVDKLWFERALGECVDGGNYNEPADADHDGCVTEEDRDVIFSDEERQKYD